MMVLSHSVRAMYRQWLLFFLVGRSNSADGFGRIMEWLMVSMVLFSLVTSMFHVWVYRGSGLKALQLDRAISVMIVNFFIVISF